MSEPEAGAPSDGVPTPACGSDVSGLAEDDARFHRLLLTGIGHAVIAVDTEATILYWNRAAEALYGWRAEEVRGRNVMDITVPDLSLREAEAIMGRLRRGESWSGEFEVRRKDGSVFTAMVTDEPVFDERGELVAIVGVTADVSSRVETEIALRESETRYRSVVELMPEPIVVYGAREILYANQAAADLAGVAGPEDLIGHEFEEFLRPEERERLVGQVVRAQAEGAVRQGVVERFRMPSGEEKVLEISSAPVHYGGKPARQAVVRDITERTRMEEELRRLASHLDSVREEDQARFGREIHDELGQILTGMKLDVAWLDRRLRSGPDTYPGPEELSQRVGDLLGQVEEAMESVRHVTRELRPTVLDDLGLEAGLDWLVHEFERRFEGCCEAVIDFSTEEGPVPGPCATALFRVVQEALTNALRHAGASRVEIRAEARDGAMVLSVQDDGSGFDEESATDSSSVGLLVMRERVRACGGTLHVRSRPGEGTSISARIPLRIADEENSP